jgi:DNA-binding phage protein
MHRVVSVLPQLLAARAISWGELARRTGLPGSRLRRLRSRDTNPRITVALRVADSLGVTVEAIWRLLRTGS